MFLSNSRCWLCTPSKKFSWEIIISKIYLPFLVPQSLALCMATCTMHGLIKYDKCLLTSGVTTISFYPAKYTYFVLSIFSSLPIEFIVTATFQCLFQFLADTSMSHSPPWGDQAVGGHRAQVSSPEPLQLPKEGCSPLEQGNQGKSKTLYQN